MAKLTPLEMIEEWRKGCSCAGPSHDEMMGLPPESSQPEECLDCTRALVDALERSLRQPPDRPRLLRNALEALRRRKPDST